MQNTELRPLGAGELLDRAVTLFVQRFVPIVTVLAVAIVPLIVLEALLAPSSAHVFADMGRILTSAGNASSSRDAIAEMTQYNSMVFQSSGVALIAVLVRLLMWSAIVYVVAVAYGNGTVAPLAEAYNVGLRCFPAQLLVGIAFSVIGSICAIPLVIAYLLVIAGIVLLSALHAGVLAAIFAIVAIVVLLAGFAVVGAFVYMTYELAAIAVVTESPNAMQAITAAVRRSVSRGTWWRTTVGGLVVFAMTQGGALPLVAVGSILTATTHIDALYFAVVGTGTILLDGLVAAFAVVFATDMRIRREGLDLVVLTQPAAPQPTPG